MRLGTTNSETRHHPLPPIRNEEEQIMGECRDTRLLKDARNSSWSKSSGGVFTGHELVGPIPAGN